MHCDIFLYADDTALYFADRDASHIEDTLNAEMQNVSYWFKANKLTLNTKKTKVMTFGTPQRLKKVPPLNIHCDGDIIEQVSTFKYLGVLLDSSLSFSAHIDYICKKVNCRLSALGRTRKFLSAKTSVMFYKSLILPYFDYCDIVWDSCSCRLKQKLQILQNRALRIVTKSHRRTHVSDLHNTTKTLTLQKRRDFHTDVFMFKAVNNLLPGYISSKFIDSSEVNPRVTRSTSTNALFVPRCKLNVGKSRISYRGATKWNSLPYRLRSAPNINLFKSWCYPPTTICML